MQNISTWVPLAALAVAALAGIGCWLWARHRAKVDTDPMEVEEEHPVRRHLHGEQPRDEHGRWK